MALGDIGKLVAGKACEFGVEKKKPGFQAGLSNRKTSVRRGICRDYFAATAFALLCSASTLTTLPTSAATPSAPSVVGVRVIFTTFAPLASTVSVLVSLSKDLRVPSVVSV